MKRLVDIPTSCLSLLSFLSAALDIQRPTLALRVAVSSHDQVLWQKYNEIEAMRQ